MTTALYTPIRGSGVISNTPSGTVYGFSPGQTVNANDADVALLESFGFTAVSSGTGGLSPIGANEILANSDTVSAIPIGTTLGTSFTLSAGTLVSLLSFGGTAGVDVSAVSNDVTFSLATINDGVLLGNYGGTVVGGPVTIGNDLSLNATGTLNGGTRLGTLTSHGVLIGAGAGSITATPTMTAGQLLVGQGPTLDPVPRAMSGDGTIDANGVLAVATVGGIVPARAVGLGLALNSGTVTAHTQVVVAATAGVNTIAVSSATTNIMINGPAAGGACTLTLAGAAGIDQRILMNISQGATPATWVFSTGFNFSTMVASPTITATAGRRDNLMLVNNVGTVFDFEAINQGFSP